jgi:Lipopolysaccharide kinase (Kdo/WaaP) family
MKSVFQSEAIKNLLTKNRLADLDSIFSAGDTSYDRHKGRCVKSIEIEDETGQPCKLFLKLFWGRRRLWPRMTDLKSGQVFQPLAEREWNGLKTITDLGINAAERMALFSEGKYIQRSAIILKEVPVPYSFHELVVNGSWGKFPRVQKSLFIDKMLETIQTIHSAGFAWRGASSKHFYPVWNENNFWDVWLIDCEGVHKGRKLKSYQKNYDNFFKSMKSSQVEEEILKELQFKANYLQLNLTKAA